MSGRYRRELARYGLLTGRCFGPYGGGPRRDFGRRLGFGRCFEPVILTKNEQKKILETELQYIELEKKEIEKKLREIESGTKCHGQDGVEE